MATKKKEKSKQRIAVAYAVDNKGRMLMGKRKDNGKWTCPGGHLYKNECIFQGMMREFEEETGIAPNSADLINATLDGKNLIYLFKLEFDQGKEFDVTKDPDKEFKELKWVNPKDVENNLHIPKSRNVAIKYHIK